MWNLCERFRRKAYMEKWFSVYRTCTDRTKAHHFSLYLKSDQISLTQTWEGSHSYCHYKSTQIASWSVINSNKTSLLLFFNRTGWYTHGSNTCLPPPSHGMEFIERERRKRMGWNSSKENEGSEWGAKDKWPKKREAPRLVCFLTQTKNTLRRSRITRFKKPIIYKIECSQLHYRSKAKSSIYSRKVLFSSSNSSSPSHPTSHSTSHSTFT